MQSLTELERFASQPFPTDFDRNFRAFYSQQDDVHGVLLALLDAVAAPDAGGEASLER